MNHQPYRGWLLAENDLSAEQEKALQEHLESCDSCQRIDTAWKELEAVIERSVQFVPTQGFVGRWQIRLVEHQQHQQRLRGWYTIGGTSLVVLSLLVVVVIQLWSLIQAPSTYITAWLNRLVGVLAIFFSIRDMIESISLPGPVYTLAAMVLLVGMVSFMSVLWLATYRKFSLARREA